MIRQRRHSSAIILFDFDKGRCAFDRDREHAIDRWLWLSIEREDRAQLRVQASISFSRSSLGASRVFSWGRISPLEKSCNSTRAKKPWRSFCLAAFKFEAMRQKINRRRFVALKNALRLPFN